MLGLLTGHARRLSFGVLTAFTSNFGQTFFIALSVPAILRDLGLGEGPFGLIYAGATLASGLALPATGRLIDRVPVRLYTLGVLGVLALASLVLAGATHAAMLAAGLVGLRLAGQGLLGHISQTTMARDFVEHRGKALGIASLGYPMGEAVLPTLFVVTAASVGWRGGWLGVAAILAVVGAPLAWWLGAERPGVATPARWPAASPPLTFVRLSRDARFRLVLPAVIVTPLLLTALFLYQGLVAAQRGWDPRFIAGVFALYAATRAIASLGVGPLIDRYTARAVLPWHMAPLALALVVLALGDARWVAAAYFALLGMTAGTMGSVLSALWAEIYGPAQVGAVRSVTTGVTVVATAVSPAAVGLLLERGVSFAAMQWGGLLLVVAAIVSAVLAPPLPSDPRNASPPGVVGKGDTSTL